MNKINPVSAIASKKSYTPWEYNLLIKDSRPKREFQEVLEIEIEKLKRGTKDVDAN